MRSPNGGEISPLWIRFPWKFAIRNSWSCWDLPAVERPPPCVWLPAWRNLAKERFSSGKKWSMMNFRKTGTWRWSSRITGFIPICQSMKTSATLSRSGKLISLSMPSRSALQRRRCNSGIFSKEDPGNSQEVSGRGLLWQEPS